VGMDEVEFVIENFRFLKQRGCITEEQVATWMESENMEREKGLWEQLGEHCLQN
jgi:hypothetical protein